MPPSTHALLQARLRAFLTTLDKASEKVKAGPVTRPLAENFNTILADVRKAYPEIADHLPQPINASQGIKAQMGICDEHYVDLQILVNQTLEVLALAQPEH